MTERIKLALLAGVAIVLCLVLYAWSAPSLESDVPLIKAPEKPHIRRP
jgi:hypothetical protein